MITFYGVSSLEAFWSNSIGNLIAGQTLLATNLALYASGGAVLSMMSIHTSTSMPDDPSPGAARDLKKASYGLTTLLMPFSELEEYSSVLGLLPKIGNPLTSLTAIIRMLHLQARCSSYTVSTPEYDRHFCKVG